MPKQWRLALIGDPVDHSRSPAIHSEALRLSGLEGSYTAVRADETGLLRAIDDLRAGRYDGLNVTMPLKEAAAAAVGLGGSINSLRVRSGSLEGISTDEVAFRAILEESAFAPVEPLLVLGSGGSARAILDGAGDRDVYVAARDAAKSEDLAKAHSNASPIAWAAGVAGALVVNCTPLGMLGEELPEIVLETAGALVDLPYGAAVTPASRRAAEAEIPLVDGFEFLARQAAASFEWWIGVPVQFEPLAAVARNV